MPRRKPHYNIIHRHTEAPRPRQYFCTYIMWQHHNKHIRSLAQCSSFNFFSKMRKPALYFSLFLSPCLSISFSLGLSPSFSDLFLAPLVQSNFISLRTAANQAYCANFCAQSGIMYVKFSLTFSVVADKLLSPPGELNQKRKEEETHLRKTKSMPRKNCSSLWVVFHAIRELSLRLCSVLPKKKTKLPPHTKILRFSITFFVVLSTPGVGTVGALQSLTFPANLPLDHIDAYRPGVFEDNRVSDYDTKSWKIMVMNIKQAMQVCLYMISLHKEL